MFICRKCPKGPAGTSRNIGAVTGGSKLSLLCPNDDGERSSASDGSSTTPFATCWNPPCNRVAVTALVSTSLRVLTQLANHLILVVLRSGGSVAKKVATALLILGWCGSVEKAAEMMGLGVKTAHDYLREVVVAIVQQYKTSTISMPHGKELERLMQASAALKPPLPGAVLYLDGSYVPYCPRAEASIDYLNHYKYKSIQWQVVCDERRRIRDICSGKSSLHQACYSYSQ